jgi:hypothetical protein
MATRSRSRDHDTSDREKTVRWSYDAEKTMPPIATSVHERPTRIEMVDTRPRPKPAAKERSVISSRLTVFLTRKQSDGLERLTREIRAGSGAFLNRGEIIRAVVGAVIDSNLDFSAVRNENDLRKLVLEKLA